MSRSSYFAILCLCLLMLVTSPVQGQIVYQEYAWEEAGLALRYPAVWAQPVITTQQETGSVTLELSSVFSDERSPAMPFIMIKRSSIPLDFVDVATALGAELASIDIVQVASSQTRLLTQNAVQLDGFSVDETSYGIARGILLPEGDILIVMGRSSNVQRDELRAIFEIVSNSLITDINGLTENPMYGVFWHVENIIGDANDTPLDAAAIALDEENRRLYVVDNLQGVIVLDSQTGREIERIPFPNDIEQPLISDAIYGQVGADTGLYLADLACGCVYILVDGEWRFPIPGSSVASHRSITIIENRLAETITTEDGQILIPLSAADDTSVMTLSEEITLNQPLLAADDNTNLLMLTDAGDIYRFNNVVPELLFNVPTGAIIQDFTVDNEGNFVILTESEGILILDNTGELVYGVGQAAFDIPRAGELLNPKAITVDSAGTLYWIDSDGNYSTITAMSLFVENGRTGRATLIAEQPVEGTLQEGQSQTWFYNATAGDIINAGVFASLEDSFNLDPTLSIFAADGTEIARMDNTIDDDELLLNPLDLYLKNITLPQTGTYRLVVESASGEGTYTLSLSSQRDIDMTVPVSETGYLAEQLPVQQWRFDGQNGQTLNISVLPNNNLLDPSLRLYAPDGELLAENTDAFDEALFPGAALDTIDLPQNGTYIIEAVHFFGEGTYTLTVERE